MTFLFPLISMKFGVIALITLIAGAIAAPALITVDDKNFEDVIIKSGKPSFVKFYAPWCFHCKEMKQAWEDLADAYVGEDVQIVEINAEENRSTRERYGISSFPQVKLFKPSQLSVPIDYSGARSVEEFAKFLHEELKIDANIGAPSMLVQFNDLNIEQFVEVKNRKALIIFTEEDNEECDDMIKEFESAAYAFHKDNNKVLIGEVKKIGLEPTDFIKNKFHIGHYPTVVYVENGDLDKYSLYEGEIKDTALVSFMNEKVGVRRALDGTLDGEAGIIPQLKDELKKFLGANVLKRRSLIADFVESMRKVDTQVYKEELKYYAVAFNQFNTNNQKFFLNEKEKYENMLEDKSISNIERDNANLKLNFLKHCETYYTDETWRPIEDLIAEKNEKEGVVDIPKKDEL